MKITLFQRIFEFDNVCHSSSVHASTMFVHWFYESLPESIIFLISIYRVRVMHKLLPSWILSLHSGYNLMLTVDIFSAHINISFFRCCLKVNIWHVYYRFDIRPFDHRCTNNLTTHETMTIAQSEQIIVRNAHTANEYFFFFSFSVV